MAGNVIPYLTLIDTAQQRAIDLGDMTDGKLTALVMKTASNDVERFENLFPIHSPLYYGRQKSKPVKYNLDSSEDWLTVTFAGLQFYAELNSGLENVAILEPKSISATPEPVPMFPFRENGCAVYDSENPTALAS